MKPNRTIRLLAATASAAAVVSSAGVASTAGASQVPHQHALFVETDATNGNSIQSYARASDGTLSLVGATSTGGLGGIAAGATADPLASQGGLVLSLDGRTLLSVNAGSNSVSVFDVSGTRLRLSQVISSGGQFPNSIAVSGSNVAVLNAGGAGSVAEFRLIGTHLQARPDQIRSLGLANSSPPDFVAGPGQLGYSPDGSKLIVADKHSNDAFQVFSVTDGGGLSSGSVTTTSQAPVPFSFTFDAAGRLVATEAGGSHLSSYTLNTDGSLSPIGTVSDGAAALCWLSSANGIFYGSNAGSATLSSFRLDNSGAPVLEQATAAATHAGTTDSVVSPDGSTIYVESGGAGALDAFHINIDGSLTPIETLWTIPVASEGIAAS